MPNSRDPDRFDRRPSDEAEELVYALRARSDQREKRTPEEKERPGPTRPNPLIPVGVFLAIVGGAGFVLRDQLFPAPSRPSPGPSVTASAPTPESAPIPIGPSKENVQTAFRLGFWWWLTVQVDPVMPPTMRFTGLPAELVFPVQGGPPAYYGLQDPGRSLDRIARKLEPSPDPLLLELLTLLQSRKGSTGALAALLTGEVLEARKILDEVRSRGAVGPLDRMVEVWILGFRHPPETLNRMAAHVETVLKLQDSPEARATRALLLLRSGDRTAAHHALLELAGMGHASMSPSWRYFAAGVLRRAQLAGEDQVLRQIIRTGDEVAPAFLRMGQILAEQREREEAIAAFRKAATLAADRHLIRLAALNGIAQLEPTSIEYDEVASRLEGAPGPMRRALGADQALGEMHLKAGRLDAAIPWLENHLTLDGPGERAVIALFAAYARVENSTRQKEVATALHQLPLKLAPETRALIDRARGDSTDSLLETEGPIGAGDF